MQCAPGNRGFRAMFLGDGDHYLTFVTSALLRPDPAIFDRIKVRVSNHIEMSYEATRGITRHYIFAHVRIYIKRNVPREHHSSRNTHFRQSEARLIVASFPNKIMNFDDDDRGDQLTNIRHCARFKMNP